MFNFYVISCFDKLYITWNQVELWNYKGNRQCPLEKDQKDYLHVRRNKKTKGDEVKVPCNSSYV